MGNQKRTKIIQSIFSDIADPRSPQNKQHLWIELIIITICAVICGANGWEEIETFAQSRETWLRQFLSLPYGVPGHDTFRGVQAQFPLIRGFFGKSEESDTVRHLKTLAAHLQNNLPGVLSAQASSSASHPFTS